MSESLGGRQAWVMAAAGTFQEACLRQRETGSSTLVPQFFAALRQHGMSRRDALAAAIVGIHSYQEDMLEVESL